MMGRRLEQLTEAGDVVPASSKRTSATSSTAAKPASTRPKPRKTSSKKAPGARLVRADDSQVIETGSPRLVGYARVSTDCRLFGGEAAIKRSKTSPSTAPSIKQFINMMTITVII